MRLSRLLAATSTTALALGLSATPAFGVVVTNTDIAISTVSISGCSGESVNVFGSLHVLIEVSSNANMAQSRLQLTSQNLSGVGMTTGAKYQVGLKMSIGERQNANNGEGAYAITLTGQLTGQGSVLNERISGSMMVHTNAAGIITVSNTSLTSTCR